MANEFNANWKGKVKYLWELLNGIVRLPAGLAFPATQVPSSDPNTLDDYEEFDITITMSAATPPTGVAYAQQGGKGVKIGRAVFFKGRCTLTNKGAGGVGAVYLVLGGAPNCANDSVGPTVNIGQVDLITLTAGYTQFNAGMSVNTANVNIGQSGSNVGSISIPWSALVNTSDFNISGHYFV